MMWQLHEWQGSARDFHSRDLPMATALWLVRTRTPAIVLGSSQRTNVVDEVAAHKAGFDTFVRRTGGGAVLVDDTAVWIDVTLPRGHRHWTDDVSASMLWLGEAWERVLSHFANTTLIAVHRGAMVRSVVSDAVCFAGRAPGEVCIENTKIGPRKIVGISQRRSRDGARFQCVVYTRWSSQWMDLVTGYDLTDADRMNAAQSGWGLEDLGVSASPEQIASALAQQLNH
jgi:lipoate-protein ligase A